MSTREERRRWLEEVRRILAEAKMSHTMSDQESELVMLGLGLDERQEALDQLWDDDTVGMVAFGDDDGWVDKRLGQL